MFPTSVRGTGFGFGSFLNSFAGLWAPILTGYLLDVSVNAALYLSAAFFVLNGVLMVCLPIETRGRQVE